jgi:hypothetical protein
MRFKISGATDCAKRPAGYRRMRWHATDGG